jgi:peptidylprolyl isomerase
MRRTLACALALVPLIGSACRQIGFQDRPVPIDHDEVVTTTGVRYEDLFQGQGATVGQGDDVLLDYTVWLDDAAQTRVDSTLDRGVPMHVKVGQAFIEGLNFGLLSMQPNGRRRIHVPAHLAYGARGVEGMIPPNSNLVFEVHAIEVHPSAH